MQVSKFICPLDHYTPCETGAPNKNTCHCILDDLDDAMNTGWKGTFALYSSKCQRQKLGGQCHSSDYLMGIRETFLNTLK